MTLKKVFSIVAFLNNAWMHYCDIDSQRNEEAGPYCTPILGDDVMLVLHQNNPRLRVRSSRNDTLYFQLLILGLIVASAFITYIS